MAKYQIFPSSHKELHDILGIVEMLKIRKHRLRDEYFGGKIPRKEYRNSTNTLRAYKLRLRQIQKALERRAAA